MGLEVIAIASLAIGAAGAGISYYGSQQQAKAASQTAKYNADIQRQQAGQERVVAAENARRQQSENRRVLASLRAANAANGLSMEGTPLAVLGETATELELQVLDLTHAADQRARALISGASLTQWEGAQRAGAIRTSAYTAALGSGASLGSGFLTSTGRVPSTTPRY